MKTRNRCLAVLFLLLALPALACRVLVIESYHPEFAWDAQYKAALATALPECRLDSFALDTKRQPESVWPARRDGALAYLKANPADLVVLGDDAAVKLLAAPLAGTSVPVVYLGVNNNPRMYPLGSNCTGVLERPLVRRNIALLQELLPGVRQVVLLFDRDLTAQVLKEEVLGKQDEQTVAGIRVRVQYLGTFAEWQSAVRAVPGDGSAAIVVATYQALHDEQGKTLDGNAVLAWTNANSRAPLFAFWEHAVGAQGAIGGMVVSGREQGRHAGRIARKILFEHVKPQDINPQIGNSSDFVFSRSQLQRFSITLPEWLAKQSRYLD